jgi:hypothetical protein
LGDLLVTIKAEERRPVANPYQSLPDSAFWKRSVAAPPEADVDPVLDTPFTIGPEEAIATAGSCFAQHISRTLAQLGYRYLVTEVEPAGGGENYGVFPARCGNIYTVRQLLQTFDRAYGLFRPMDEAWRRADGALVDPFRPQIQSGGFNTVEALEADRKRHLASVRAMFEDCDVFIFTLGLTEGWRSTRDGAVFPVAPGVSGGEPGPAYEFHNAPVEEVTGDLCAFVRKLRTVNPGVRIILTVSPVPLIATYERRHVLVSNSWSKAVLRVAAGQAAATEPDVCYFPSFEIVTGPQARGRYFADDLRSVTEAGVSRVMDVFGRHFLGDRTERPAIAAQPTEALSASDQRRFEALAEVVCDEEAIDPG